MIDPVPLPLKRQRRNRWRRAELYDADCIVQDVSIEKGMEEEVEKGGGQSISVRLGNYTFPLDVYSQEEESRIRFAVDMVNSQINSLTKDYAGVDMEKVLSVVLLNEELRLVELESDDKKYINDVQRRLHSIDERLGEYLGRQFCSVPKSTF